MMHPATVLALLVGTAASIEDLARRQVSNWIPLTALLGGLVLNSVERGWLGALSSLGGAVAGFLVFFVFYWLGGMGGGDIKLMAGLGAILGLPRLWEAALWTAGCGGLFALAWLGLFSLWNAWRRWRSPGHVAPRVEAIPYAPAIAVGAWLSLVPKG